MNMKKREVRLSKRLQAVAAMVTKGNVVCDVGCDHGFVPVYLVLNGISPNVIAMDVNEGPLTAAKGHIREYFLTDYIETRLSDGLTALRAGEADTLICAGMGGRLVVKILEEGKEKLAGMKELVLQPQSDLQYVRKYLREKGYAIADENMVVEDGKYYPMMRVCPERSGKYLLKDGLPESVQNWKEEKEQEDMPGKIRMEDKYGPVLLRKKHPVLRAYLEREAGIYRQILTKLKTNGNGQGTRQQEVMYQLGDTQAALSYFESHGNVEHLPFE